MALNVTSRLMAAGTLSAALVVIVYLALFDPTQWPAPRCLFNAATGLECPGCGTQRAVHAAFSGDFAAAWRYNAALFFALPLAVVYTLAPKRWHTVLFNPAAYICIATLIVGWWILRNLF